MARRKYRLQDVKDYIYEEYGLDWKDYMTRDNDLIRGVRSTDFDEDRLSVVGFMYKDGRKVGVRWIQASNTSLSVSGFKTEREDWQDFLAKRYSQEQTLNK